MTTLKTQRLELRPPRMGDADPITRLLQDRRIADMTALIPWPYEKAHALEWLRQSIERHLAGEPETFVITRRGSGEVMGAIGLHPSGENPWAEFGYWLGVDHWGRGYATEALREILRFGFEDRGFRRIEAYHFLHNPASGRVMEKAGLRFEGVQRLRARRGGQLFDRVNRGITDAEWRAAGGRPQA